MLRLKKCLLFIGLGIGFLLLSWPKAEAAEVSFSRGNQDALADSIMDKVFFFAPFYGGIVESYHADLYIKGKVDVKKKNFIIRYLPTMFRPQKHVREYMTETYSELHFISPTTYEQTIKGSIGTASRLWEADGRLLEYFHINVYAPTLLYDKLLSPLAPNAWKHYTYCIDSVMGDSHNRQYKVRFIPRNSSYQLVGGYLIVSADVWSIREMRFFGRSEMFRFCNHMKMGEVGAADEFLPVRCDVEGNFRFFGNVIDGNYVAVLNYDDIRQRSPASIRKKAFKDKYDLTLSHLIKADADTVYRDTSYFNKLRPLPLEQHEQDLYANVFLQRDSLSKKEKSIAFWGQFGDALINNYAIDLAEMGNIRFSPLINPLMFGYSAQNGVSYSQDFRYNRLFANSRWLRIAPSLGYNFKYKELYWRVNSSFNYWPNKRASIHLDFGNGNRIYSSTVLDELETLPDSIFDFNKLNLRFYKDLYLKVRHSWEVVNGLTLDLSISMHRRTSKSKIELPPVTVQPDGTPSSLKGTNNIGMLDDIFEVSNSFAPGVRLTWTPAQYYYMSGKRKVNLYSKYPTISLDWERGIEGIFPRSGNHERFEVDLQHNISLGLMRHLYYRLGWGAFTKSEGLYFVDFANLWRSNLPSGWNDDLGGVFQLLDRRWYNSSHKYVRGHITYESPFLLIRHLRKITQYVLNERIYLNTLFVPHLSPYLELGYGIGTHVFDLGFFASFANWEYKEMGVKFTFELFNR